MVSLSLPIYYSGFGKTVLIGSNWSRNAHYMKLNKVKKHYHKLVFLLIRDFTPIVGAYTVSYTYFYKNTLSDGSNVVSQIEKYFLDGIQEIGLVQNDNVNFHLGSNWVIGGKDIKNPRVEITVKGIS